MAKRVLPLAVATLVALAAFILTTFCTFTAALNLTAESGNIDTGIAAVFLLPCYLALGAIAAGIAFFLVLKRNWS